MPGLIEPVERPVVRFFAGILARRFRADQCTALGIASAGLCFSAYALSNVMIGFLWIAVAALMLHWLFDRADGAVARLRREDRPRYGFFVDHIADAVSMTLIFAGLGLSPRVSLTVALVALVCVQLLTIMVLLRSPTRRLIQPRLGPSETHLLLIVLTVAMLLLGDAGPAYTFVVAAYAAITVSFVAWESWQEAGRLALQERFPVKERVSP
jgi:archaetidylinositol phosphate synthase